MKLCSLLLYSILPLVGQSGDSGISLKSTVSTGAMFTDRLQVVTPNASRVTPGYRVMLYPSIKLGQHWFGYAAVQHLGAPYFFYDAYHSARRYDTEVIQAFAGYQFKADRATVVLKAGKLSSAFGSFPLRYDDLQNPVFDQPLSYIQTLTLRQDQLPCGTGDLRAQSYGFVMHRCGGKAGPSRGLTPVTLYGLPGVEADISAGRFDGRAQMTVGSPSFGDGLSSFRRDHTQWTAGAGYSIRQGFRVGLSVLRGLYLDSVTARFLPAGTTIRDYQANAWGIDAQWARGRVSLQGEVHRFHYASPNFSKSPSLLSAYGEAKVTLSPRLYVAGRAGTITPGSVTDLGGVSADHFGAGMQSYEAAVGVWLARRVLFKGGYEWLHNEAQGGRRFDVAGLQLVVGLPTVGFAFKK